MCGLIGRWSRAPVSWTELTRGVDHLRPRGPDSQSTLRFESGDRHLTLGFCRLSVRDVSHAADQPMSRGPWTVLFNGEIYNSAALRRELEARHGHRFLTDCDTEVVLALLEHEGVAAIEKLEGMFAITAYDSTSRSLALARDPFGVKPLYWSRQGDDVAFGSTIYAVRQIRRGGAIDTGFFERMIALDHFVGYDGRTPFADIDSVRPGTIVEIASDGRVHERTFWSARTFAGDGEAADPQQVRDLLQESVRSQLVSDVPLSAALSGGIDSSLIAYLAHQRRQDLHFFTIDFESGGAKFDEDADYSRLMCDRLGVGADQYHVVDGGEDWSLDLVDGFVEALGTPVYDERALVWENLYRSVREHGATVFLNGQGADELWYGYYPRIGWDWFTDLYHESFDESTYLEHFAHRSRSSVVYQAAHPTVAKMRDDLASEVFQRVRAASCSANPAHRLSAFLVSEPLVNLLAMEDAFSMRHSIEVRVPFLSRPLADLALRMSPEAHLGDREAGKDALKAAVAPWLPQPVLERPKSPLPKPPPNDDVIRALFREHLTDIKDCDLVDRFYDVNRLGDLAAAEGAGFYGGSTEALLQVLSTWRFSEVMDV